MFPTPKLLTDHSQHSYPPAAPCAPIPGASHTAELNPELPHGRTKDREETAYLNSSANQRMSGSGQKLMSSAIHSNPCAAPSVPQEWDKRYQSSAQPVTIRVKFSSYLQEESILPTTPILPTPSSLLVFPSGTAKTSSYPSH